jgi:hypothetical protein
LSSKKAQKFFRITFHSSKVHLIANLSHLLFELRFDSLSYDRLKIFNTLLEYDGNSLIDTFVYDELQSYCHYITLIEQE